MGTGGDEKTVAIPETETLTEVTVGDTGKERSDEAAETEQTAPSPPDDPPVQSPETEHTAGAKDESAVGVGESAAKKLISVGLDFSRVDVFALGNYTFGRKDTESKGQDMRAVPADEIAAHREKRFLERGMRRSVAAVLLVHVKNFPHVLLLQQSSGDGEFALPGGRLRPGECEEDGLRRKLSAKLSPENSAMQTEWDIGDELAKWWDIDFSRRLYPYIPAHVTKPKEQLAVYSVSLPEKSTFAVPKNLQLVAVPLFELFGNSASYGPVISSVPALLSRVYINPH